MKILVINGANLNRLGHRESEYYGKFTLSQLNKELKSTFEGKVDLVFFQSNIEGEIIHCIHEAPSQLITAMVINAGAFTHTSIAIRDAILSVGVPFIEVHISNIYKRESFRKVSYLSDIAVGNITGLGKESYKLAIQYWVYENGKY